MTRIINNCWGGTEVSSLKANGKGSRNILSKQSLLRPFFGRTFSHPFIGKCTTLCRLLDRGFESSLFQNMDVHSLRTVIHLSSSFLLAYSTFLFFFYHFLFTYFHSSLHAFVFLVPMLCPPFLLPLLTAHPVNLIGKRIFDDL